jgi:phosphoenolpyruvate carboxylase
MLNAVPEELRNLVSESLRCLGEIILNKEGKKFFTEVEDLRLLTRSLRDADDEHVFVELQKALNVYFKKNSAHKLERITKSFGLALELINVCETSYRSFRIIKNSTTYEKQGQNPTSVTWVFTAHPTEARTEDTIEIFRRIQNLMIETLQGSRASFPNDELKYLLNLAWHADLAPTSKPSVEDEARHILNIVLSDESQKTVANFIRHSGHQLKLRTWVGGDKDGHPGVGPKQTLNSLQLSRDIILPKVFSLLESVLGDLKKHPASDSKNTTQKLIKSIQRIKTSSRALRKLTANDGKRVAAWNKSFHALSSQIEKELGSNFEQFTKIKSIFEVFPYLVLPLEMREDAAILKEIIESPKSKQKKFAIVQMLEKVKWLSGSGAQNYLQGFVISQCNESEDFMNALNLVNTYLGDERLPVIPLFENRHALETATTMVSKILTNKSVRQLIEAKWNHKLEVMVGYSDSSKEMGVLSSRYLIAKTLPQIASICSEKKITPIFFHGSGGSISRGGGSTSEQCSWWPAEAKSRIKMTIQGEMVQRSFASGPILIQNLKKLIEQNQTTAAKHHQTSAALAIFVSAQEKHYRNLVSEPKFLKLISEATPYEYLQHLQIGSRPAKRKKLDGISSLRAIPWVLCWTQTRSLLPVWWGIGSAWDAASEAERKAIYEDFKNSELISSYVKQLGFSLAKVEPGIWRLYLENLSTDEEYRKEFFAKFETEFAGACNFVQAMSGSKDLLWFRPWLGASIKVRSPMIFPIHLVQLWALKNHDVSLMRQTVTAIASGMLTTG